MASWIFSKASATVVPWEWQPGNSGQLTETPSECSNKVTWNLLFILIAGYVPGSVSSTRVLDDAKSKPCCRQGFTGLRHRNRIKHFLDDRIRRHRLRFGF